MRIFLLLQKRSAAQGDVYPYWDILQSKLKSDNSYQRSIGLMLIAENARWDTEGRTETLPLLPIKDTMRKSVLLDILNVLLEIRKTSRTDGMEDYLQRALSGGILDPKSAKQIRALL